MRVLSFMRPLAKPLPSTPRPRPRRPPLPSPWPGPKQRWPSEPPVEIEATDFIYSEPPPPGLEGDLELDIELELPSSDLELTELPPTSLFGGPWLSSNHDQTGLTLLSASTV